MTDTPRSEDAQGADGRQRTDGGSKTAAITAGWGDVLPGVTGTPTPDGPLLGVSHDRHLFAPAELPRWALALPALGALVAAAGTGAPALLAAGTFPAAVGSAAVALAMVVAAALALRFA